MCQGFIGIYLAESGHGLGLGLTQLGSIMELGKHAWT